MHVQYGGQGSAFGTKPQCAYAIETRFLTWRVGSPLAVGQRLSKPRSSIDQIIGRGTSGPFRRQYDSVSGWLVHALSAPITVFFGGSVTLNRFAAMKPPSTASVCPVT